MAKFIPVNDIFLPEEDHVTFDQFNQADDRERWRGRASLLELPEGGGIYGAGGNADGSGDPIDTYNSKHRGSLIVGPETFVKGGNAKK